MRYLLPVVILICLSWGGAAAQTTGGQEGSTPSRPDEALDRESSTEPGVPGLLDLDAMPPMRRLKRVVTLMRTTAGARRLGEYLRDASSRPEIACAHGMLGFITARRGPFSEIEAMRFAVTYRIAVHSTDPEIQRLAFSGLGALGRRGLADKDLAKLLLEGPPEKCGPVLMAIGAAGSPDILPALGSFLKKEKLSSRERALAAQAAAGIHSPKAVALLHKLVSDGEEYVALNAVRALGRQPFPEAAAALDLATEDKRPAIRAAAYSELFYFVPAGVLSADNGRKLWEFAHRLDNEDPRVQPELAALLARGGRSEGRKLLVEAAASEGSHATLMRIVTGLGYRPGEDTLSIIDDIAAAFRGDEAVSAAALRAMGRIKSKEAVRKLLEVYTGDAPEAENARLRVLKGAALDGLYLAGGVLPEEIIDAVRAGKIRMPEALMLLSIARWPEKELGPALEAFLKQHLELPGRTLPTAALVIMARRGLEKARLAFQPDDPAGRIIEDGPEAAFMDPAASKEQRRLAWITAVMEPGAGPAARILSSMVEGRVVWSTPPFFPFALAWRDDILPVILKNWGGLPEEVRLSVRDALERFRDVRDPGACDDDAAAYFAFFTGTALTAEEMPPPPPPVVKTETGRLVLENGRLFWQERDYDRPPVIWLAIEADKAKRLGPLIRSMGGMVVTEPYLPSDVMVTAQESPPAEDARMARIVVQLSDFLAIVGLDAIPPPKPLKKLSREDIERMYREVEEIDKKSH